MNKIKRFILMIIGVLFMGIGISITIKSKHGGDAMAYFWLGISKISEISVGEANVIFSFILLIPPLLFNRKLINIGTILAPIIISLVIDLTSFNYISPNNDASHMAVSLSGFLLLSLGISIYMSTNLGRSTYDATITVLSDYFNLTYGVIRKYFDFGLILSAYIIGVKLTLGPILGFLLIGNLVDFFNKVLPMDANVH